MLISVTQWLVTAGTKRSLHGEHGQAVCEHKAAPGDRAGAGVPLLPKQRGRHSHGRDPRAAEGLTGHSLRQVFPHVPPKKYFSHKLAVLLDKER